MQQSLPADPHLLWDTHLLLVIPSGLFPSAFPTKSVHAYLISTMRALCSDHLILLDLIATEHKQ